MLGGVGGEWGIKLDGGSGEGSSARVGKGGVAGSVEFRGSDGPASEEPLAKWKACWTFVLARVRPKLHVRRRPSSLSLLRTVVSSPPSRPSTSPVLPARLVRPGSTLAKADLSDGLLGGRTEAEVWDEGAGSCWAFEPEADALRARAK